MPELHVRLFRKFSARQGDQALTGLRTGKVQELLCYLLLHRRQASPRDVVATLLWDRNTTDQARAYLRSALWKLQSILCAQLGVDRGAVLLTGPSWVQWHPDLPLWLDVEAFEAAYEAVEGEPGSGLHDDEVCRLEQAIALYEGDLLEDYYQEWCLFKRERYRHLYLILLDKVAAYWEAHRAYERATSFAERILACDRARERTHRQLIRLRHLAGDRTGALHQYERCAALLREDFQIAPSEQTRRLYEQVRADTLDAAPEPAPEPAPTLSPPPDDPPFDAIYHILDALVHTQGQLRGRVEALEREWREKNHT